MTEPLAEDELVRIRRAMEVGLYGDAQPADVAALLAEVERLREITRLPMPEGGCACWLPPEQWDTSYYGIAEPASQMEYDPACPEHSQHVWDPRRGLWAFRTDFEATP